MKRPRRTFEAIVEVLQDGAWHEVGDLTAVTNFPAEWVSELRAEGVLEVQEGVVTMVRLRTDQPAARIPATA